MAAQASASAKALCDSLILYSEVIQQGFIVILCGETGVTEIALDLWPLLESSIIESSEVFCNDERNYAIGETLLEQDEPSYTTITILERMNSFKPLVEVEDIIKSLLFLPVRKAPSSFP